MKYFFPVLACLILMACSNENPASVNGDPHLISDEVFKMKLGNDEVYGVRLKMTSPEKRAYLSYAVRLSQNEKVWLDTIYTEVSAGDTIESELIFSEAIVDPDDLVEVKAESVNLD